MAAPLDGVFHSRSVPQDDAQWPDDLDALTPPETHPEVGTVKQPGSVAQHGGRVGVTNELLEILGGRVVNPISAQQLLGRLPARQSVLRRHTGGCLTIATRASGSDIAVSPASIAFR